MEAEKDSTKNTHKEVFNRMKLKRKGDIFFVTDFEDLGTSDSVRAALSRLTKEKEIIRLGQGIYQYPKRKGILGPLKATAEEVAEAVAKKDGARIMPTGTYALNKLGLSTQVPKNLIYITDGIPRKLKVGKRTVLFKRATTKKLSIKGKIDQLVFQALAELGRKGVDEIVLKKVFQVLDHEKTNVIKEDVKFAPAWIRVIIKQYLDQRM